MCRPRLAHVTLALLVALHASAQAPPPPPVGGALPGLTPAELADFLDGQQAFLHSFTPPEGLGPMFNDSACAPCHAQPAPGGGSGRLVTRFGRRDGRGGGFDPLEGLGGSLIQSRALLGPPCNLRPEVVPPEANVVAQRRTQPLFGLGLVDAVLDSSLEAMAQQQRAADPASAGRVHYVTEVATGALRAGRFGWKAQVATLQDFSGDAMLNEMGLTNPLFPEESCPQGDCALLACDPQPSLDDDGSLIARLTAFQRLLAPPRRGPITSAVVAGEAVFEAVGCARCHAGTLQTGPHPVAALDAVEFHPYSDFLLHDMGRLGDGIVQGNAQGGELRTAPLWGLRFMPRLLHDGRATTIEAAILAHDGQAAAARRAYGRLSTVDRARLLAFLQSL